MESEPPLSEHSKWFAWMLQLPSLTNEQCSKICGVMDELSDEEILPMVTVDNSQKLFATTDNDDDLVNNRDQMGAIVCLDRFSSEIIEANGAIILERIDAIMDKGMNYMYAEEFCDYWESACEILTPQMPEQLKLFVYDTLLPRLQNTNDDIRMNTVLMLADITAVDQTLIAQCANDISKSVNETGGWDNYEDGHKKRLLNKIRLFQDWLSSLLTDNMDIENEVLITFHHTNKTNECEKHHYFQSNTTNFVIIETVDMFGEHNYAAAESEDEDESFEESEHETIDSNASIYTCSKCGFEGTWEYGDGDTFHFYSENPDEIDQTEDDELVCVDPERDFICTNCEKEVNS